MANPVLQCLSAMLFTMALAIITMHTIHKVPSPPGPLNMHKSHVLTTRVELSWEASPGYLDSYLVMLKNCAGDVLAKKSTESTRPTVLLDNPRTETVYEVVIWSVADGKISDPTTSKIQVEESNLRIRNLVVKDRGTTFVDLGWTRPVYSLVESFEVRLYSVQSKPVQTFKVNPDVTVLHMKILTPGQLFTFAFTSVLPTQCGEKERVQSEDISVRTMPSTPGPINMHKSHVLTTRVELSWEASPGYLDSYLVMLKNCAGDVVAKKSTESTRPTVSLDNIWTGTAYEVVLWAVADETISDPYTTIIRVKESNLRFRNLIVKERGTTFVELEWTRPVYGLVESYEVRWYSVYLKSVQTRKIDSDETSFHVEDLTPGQLFKFIVTSVLPSHCGDEERVHSEDISVRTRPAMPGMVFQSSIETTSIDLQWTDSEGIVDKYIVKVSAGCEVISKQESNWPTVNIQNLKADTKYQVDIYSVSGDMRSIPLSKKLKTENERLKTNRRQVEERQEPPFIDKKRSYTTSTSIALMTIKTSKFIWKHIIVRKQEDMSEVVRLERREDTVLVEENIDINTDFQIEIYVEIAGIRSESQFVYMKTKDVRVSMPCLIGAIVGGTIAIGSLGTIGPMLAALGFGSGGIISGTIAAWLMSFGNVSAGSLFAILQSVGVVGLSVAAKATFIAVGLSAGCMVEVV